MSSVVFTPAGPSQHLYDPTAAASAGEPIAFVVYPHPGDGSRCDSVITLNAAAKKKAGGAPEKTPWTEPEEEEEKPEPKDEEAELAEQIAFVERKFKAISKMKPKFMPVGPKPWNKRGFKKVCIQVRLKSKQASNIKITNQVTEELRRISGVHPRIVKARQNVQMFGWRVGYPCGVAVTLQGGMMHNFLTRLNTVVLPRVRDFEGLCPNSLDKYGNFCMGLTNQDVFKELDAMIDTRELTHGFDVNIIMNCMDQTQGMQLMKEFGFPFGDPVQRFKKNKKGLHVLRGKKDLFG